MRITILRLRVIKEMRVVVVRMGTTTMTERDRDKKKTVVVDRVLAMMMTMGIIITWATKKEKVTRMVKRTVMTMIPTTTMAMIPIIHPTDTAVKDMTCLEPTDMEAMVVKGNMTTVAALALALVMITAASGTVTITVRIRISTSTSQMMGIIRNTKCTGDPSSRGEGYFR